MGTGDRVGSRGQRVEWMDDVATVRTLVPGPGGAGGRGDGGLEDEVASQGVGGGGIARLAGGGKATSDE